jgi:hypothetical protein
MLPSRHGRNDRELIAIAHRGVKSADKPDIVIVEVDGHERILLPAFIDQTRREGRVALRECLYGGTDCRAVDVDDPCAIGEGSKDRRKVNRDCHDVLEECCYVVVATSASTALKRAGIYGAGAIA